MQSTILFIVLAITMPYAMAGFQSSSYSSSSLGGVSSTSGGGQGQSITVINGVVSCGGLKCPSSAQSCRISSDTNADNSQVTHKSECRDGSGKVVATSSLSEKNPSGQAIHSVSESGGSASSVQYTSNGGGGSNAQFDSQKAFQDSQRIQNDINRQINQNMGGFGFGGGYAPGFVQPRFY